MSEEKLAPCIWCGSTNIRLVVRHFSHDFFGVICCSECKLQTQSIIKKTQSEVEQYLASRWNALPRKSDVKRLDKEADWLAEIIEKIVYISYDYIDKPESEEWCERLIELCLGDDEISWREAARKVVEETK